MKPHEVREIAQCLPRGKTPFHYFKDRYALWLLSRYVGSGKKVRDVKTSRYGRLLQKPILHSALGACASGVITADTILTASGQRQEAYHLSLGMWGGRANRRNPYFQTSRPGKNLVLQLNFTSKHEALHDRVFNLSANGHPLVCRYHPVARGNCRTMAWARCDIDLRSGEALIEEIQNDWLRYAEWEPGYVRHMSPTRRADYFTQYYREDVRRIDMRRYFVDALSPHRAIWDEAMLNATLWFLREELGIQHIYYNTWDTGCRFKGISQNDRPPRSLYSKLPRRFCFEETADPPTFLQRYWARRLRTHPDRHTFRWYRLDL
jgi:hypothetical protein